VTFPPNHKGDLIAASFNCNQHESPLLRLPPELRNKIYEYALSGYELRFVDWAPEPVSITRRSTSKGFIYHVDDVNTPFALPKVSRQLRAETSILPYKLNVLGGNVGRLLDAVLSRVPFSIMKTIRMVQLVGPLKTLLSQPEVNLRKLIGFMNGLQCVVLEGTLQRPPDEWDASSRTIKKQVEHALEQSGRVKVEVSMVPRYIYGTRLAVGLASEVDPRPYWMR